MPGGEERWCLACIKQKSEGVQWTSPKRAWHTYHFNILLRVAEASSFFPRKLSDLSATRNISIHWTLRGPLHPSQTPWIPWELVKPLWRWLGKKLCCFAFVSCWGVHSQKPIWNLKRKIIFPTTMLGFNLDFFFEGGVTNYIVSEKNVRNSSTHDVLRLRPNGRHLELWMCCLGDGHC